MRQMYGRHGITLTRFLSISAQKEFFNLAFDYDAVKVAKSALLEAGFK
jgi:hypothetical protein